ALSLRGRRSGSRGEEPYVGKSACLVLRAAGAQLRRMVVRST
ncbi:MAG: hypothetical protein ACI9UA_005681, partial [Pseudoalteromonas tetraodonis]